MTLPALPLYNGCGLTSRSLLLLALTNLVDDCSIGDLLDLDVSDDTLASMVAYAALRNSQYEQATARMDARMEGFQEGFQEGFNKAREIYRT